LRLNHMKLAAERFRQVAAALLNAADARQAK
jgi:hypothetical protein